MDIAIKLRQLRNERRVTVMELANGIGVSKQAIYDYEKGGVMAPAKRLKQLADFFKVPIDYFYSENQFQVLKMKEVEVDTKPNDYLSKYVKQLEDTLNEVLVQNTKLMEQQDKLTELLAKPSASEWSNYIVKTISPFIELGMIA